MKLLFRLFLVLLLVALAALGWLYFRLDQPYFSASNPVLLDFPVGTRTEEMAQMLAAKGVVNKPWLFTAARVFSPRAVLQAGEYRFDKPASTLEVFGRIARGDTYYAVVTVPEGHNLFDIAEDLRPLGIISPEKFLKVARNPKTILDLDPHAPSLEGFLFPDSYRLNRHTTAEALCRAMTARFREEWKRLGSPRDVHGIVTLASMVEREAKRPEERPLVASVFANRLRLGMKLECDPTTVYAALLEQRYRGKIYRSDLNSTNAYNTYQHAGLPPGPIANPGLQSLEAAAAPRKTDYLFFVAKGDGSGGHTFSETLTGHLAATALLRAAERH